MVQAKKPALLAKTAALKERHALEEKEERLTKKKREEIRRQKETDFEAELSAANAKLTMLSGAVEQGAASTPADGMNDYTEERNMELSMTSLCFKHALDKVSKVTTVGAVTPVPGVTAGYSRKPKRPRVQRKDHRLSVQHKAVMLSCNLLLRNPLITQTKSSSGKVLYCQKRNKSSTGHFRIM